MVPTFIGPLTLKKHPEEQKKWPPAGLCFVVAPRLCYAEVAMGYNINPAAAAFFLSVYASTVF